MLECSSRSVVPGAFLILSINMVRLLNVLVFVFCSLEYRRKQASVLHPLNLVAAVEIGVVLKLLAGLYLNKEGI